MRVWDRLPNNKAKEGAGNINAPPHRSTDCHRLDNRCPAQVQKKKEEG